MAKGDPVYGAHNDNVNQVYTQLGVIGTLGTADEQGTALTLPMAVDPSTGAQYVYNLGPAGSVSLGDITGGTINRIGSIDTIGTMPAISIGPSTGGTLDLLKLGTVVVSNTGTNPVPVSPPAAGYLIVRPDDGTVGFVGTIGTIQTGTITTVQNVTHGTIENSGTVTGVGVVSAITNGSIVVTAGTVTVGNIGTIGTIQSGTVSVNTPGTITSGTITPSGGTVGTVPGVGVVSAITSGTVTTTGGTIGTVTTVTTVSNVTNGTIRVTAGTVNSGTINAGTINLGSVGGRGANAAATVGFPVLTAGMDSGGSAYTFLVDTTRRIHDVVEVGTINSGTINAGTINAGTFTMTVGTLTAGTINTGTINAATINAGTTRDDGRPARNILSFATSVALGGTAYGTVIGSASVGAGTSIWVNDVSILNEGGTVTCAVGFGTFNSGTATLWRGILGPREGIQKSFPKAVNCGMTNSDFTVYALQAATVDVAVTYFISA